MRGLFITFEGIDGSGKTSLMKNLANYMPAKREVILTREPGGTPLAEELRDSILKHRDETVLAATEILVMFAARIQHAHNVIQPALDRGAIVLCDRYLDSTFAYQGSLNTHSYSLVANLADSLIDTIPQPDLTLLLDLDPKVAQSRLSARDEAKNRIDVMDLEFHKRVREALIERTRYARITVIDASRVYLSVLAQCMEATSQLMKRFDV